ncbi:MAG: hypothetical protein Q7K65_02100 [Candidatus Buchananbacteria bacterium]|nr:hypothetical protein [Candidatus Buchananbacteria bacterium]
MPYRKIFFEKNQPVHVVSRALTDVFRQKEDCDRFIFQFYAVNLGKKGFNMKTKDMIKAGQSLLRGEKIPERFVIKEHAPLVHLLDFSLVVNHYHFYLLPTIDGSIVHLMHRLNDSFARSFNLLHNRKDAVFGCRYKGIAVETDFQSHAVSRYVSIMNPLDVFQPGWREYGLKNPKEAFNFLENYEFSSFPDKIGKRSSLILAPREILEQYTPFWGDKEEYRKFVAGFLKERSVLPNDFLIE